MLKKNFLKYLLLFDADSQRKGLLEGLGKVAKAAVNNKVYAKKIDEDLSKIKEELMDAVEEYSVCCHKVHLRGATEVEICSDDTIAAVKLLQMKFCKLLRNCFTRACTIVLGYECKKGGTKVQSGTING